MNYYINLFSPNTANAFANSDQSVTGFRISRKTYVENQNIKKGDKFICYCTKIQRFIGILEALESYYIDESPLFVSKDDPFILRFKVKPIVWLSLDKGIPIHNDLMWNNLSFTKDLSKNSTNWTYKVFSSPYIWSKKDSEFIEKELINQSKILKTYPFTDKDEKNLRGSKIKISEGKEISVSVPENEEEKEIKENISNKRELRESLKVQSLLAEIGEKLGFKIWLPINDKNKILELWKPKKETLLEELPLVFDETTLKTIKNIDVLWIKRRSIARAFEVEDTTSIYSGILRMADLLSLQPMLDIKIHIVAPDTRREAVFQQIARPVFAVMEKGPLSEFCTFLSYTSIVELSKENKLEFMTDNILQSYEEFVSD